MAVRAGGSTIDTKSKNKLTIMNMRDRMTIMPMKLMAMTCVVCEYSWNPRVGIPKECPNCKSRRWNNGMSKVEGQSNQAQIQGRDMQALRKIASGGFTSRSEPEEEEIRDAERDCPDCGEVMLDNRKLNLWMCKCGFQKRKR
jgi:predicted RNA-binding Zn-ribbon protein involved in translation (DUF1610 family)